MERTIESNRLVSKTYTAEQVAAILGVSVRKVYLLCEATKDFKVIRMGKRCLRIHKESFNKWFDNMCGIQWYDRRDDLRAYFDDLYSDYGLLLCQADGRPIDQKALGKAFKELQRSLRIPKEEQIEFQGLRKSRQMHKVRLTQNNYQLVAENSGQSPEVLMSNYNEAREIEKRALAAMVERSFYPEIAVSTPQAASIMEVLNQNPDLAGQILKNLLLQTAYAQPNTTVTG